MQLNPDELSTGRLYRWMVSLITPRPIAWVSTVSTGGAVNLSPFSFFNGVGANPPSVVFCPANRPDGQPKDTLSNIRDTGQFVINLVTDELVDAMNATSAEYPRGVDEFDATRTAKADSAVVSPPRVAESAASLECQLHEAIQLGVGPGGANVVIGRIVWIHVNDRLLDPSGRLDPDRLATVGRMGGEDYVHTSDRFRMPRPKLD